MRIGGSPSLVAVGRVLRFLVEDCRRPQAEVRQRGRPACNALLDRKFSHQLLNALLSEPGSIGSVSCAQFLLVVLSS